MLYDLDSKPIGFTSAEDAADRLLEVLPVKRMKEEKWLIVVISSKAVKMGEKIASKLNLYYDFLFTTPILAPNNSECEIAKVSETEEIVIHKELSESFDIKKEYIYGEAHRKYEEKILKDVYKYRKGELISSLEGSTVLLLDVGSESGLTALTAIKTAIKEKAKSVIYASPIVPMHLDSEFENVTDEFYTLYHIENFVDVEFYYENLHKPTSEEIMQVVENSKHYLPLQKINIGEEDQ